MARVMDNDRMHPWGFRFFWPLVLLGLAGWAVALGGLAAVTNSCINYPNTGNGTNFYDFSVGIGLPYRLANCGKILRFIWWILFFDLFVLLGLLLSKLLGHLRWQRLAWIGLLAADVALSMWATNVSLNAIDTTDGTWRTRARIQFAGFLIKTVALSLLFFCVGSEDPATFEDRESRTTTTTTYATGAVPVTGANKPGYGTTAPVYASPAGTTTTTGAHAV